MAEHANAQKRLADALAAALGSGYIVRPYSWGPDGKQTGRRYVSVYRSEITRIVPESSQQLPDGTLAHVLTVDVLSPHQDMGKAETDLYEATDEVLAVIDHDGALAGYAWTSAERQILGGEDSQFHAMRISAWCLTTETEE